jgi:hypothetical protein
MLLSLDIINSVQLVSPEATTVKDRNGCMPWHVACAQQCPNLEFFFY